MKTDPHADWNSQKLFLKQLADINGIEFNPDMFPNKTVKRGLFNKGYLQSDAALYMAKQIDRLKTSGATIIFPWNTSPVRVGFNGEMYSRTPWRYFPVVTTPKYVKDQDLITALSIDKSTGPEKYLSDDIGRISVMLLCKDCHCEWQHRCGGSGFAGVAHVNSNDICETEVGNTVQKFFCCPFCGSTKVYRIVGGLHWD